MTTAHDLVAYARTALASLQDRSGQVLMSGASTLRPGRIYLLGLNPGGDPDNHALMTIGQSLDDLVSRTRAERNSYLVEWPGGARKNLVRHRILDLIWGLGLEPHEVCASNLIFTRSPGEASCSYQDLEACWRVHEHILRVVRPKAIVTYGSPVYDALVRRYATWGCVEEHRPVAYCPGPWQARSLHVREGVRLIGLPHVSRYAVNKDVDTLRWVRDRVQ